MSRDWLRSGEPINLYSRGLRGLYHWLLLKVGMWILRRGFAPWKNRTVFIVDGERVSSFCTLPSLDVLSTTMVMHSIWLSLETSEDPGRKPLVSSGDAKEGPGTSQIQSISGFTGQSPGAVSPDFSTE